MTGILVSAERLAARLMWQAALTSAVVVLAIVALPLTAGNLLGVAALALAANLAFDALLFRVIASHGDEETGGAAVDDLLRRMRLKPLPPATRPFAERAAGARRLAAIQLGVALLYLAVAATAAMDRAP